MKENGFTLKKKKTRSRQYPAGTMTNANYADDPALPANILAQAESLMHSLEEGGIGLSLQIMPSKCAFNKEELSLL